MAKTREIRDPIHGFIQRTELEQNLIDTNIFQRLRGVKQLAMANLVYPGALHTRFDHSIGVMHVAGRLAQQLEIEDETLRIVRIAGLLHDIGHGPFSHVSEEILDRYYDKSKFKPTTTEKIHEFVTCAIIEKAEEINGLLSNSDCDKVISLLQGTQGESIEKGVVSGPLDADKQDYLLRDSYFCGVKYGVFDIERLISTLQRWSEGHDNILAASRDGVYAIEQFIIAKYHMSTQVYRHKVRLITDAMIVRALELGLEKDRLKWLRDLYAFDGSDKYVRNYVAWDDARLVNQLLYSEKSKGFARDLFLRLKQRRLFKRVFTQLTPEFPAKARFVLSKIKEGKFQKLRKEIEGTIADYLSKKCKTKISPFHVIAMSYVFLGTVKQDRARSRFDAAHELGHLLSHQHYSDDELASKNQEIEREADAFAGAFLLPRDSFSKDVSDTSLDGFKRLKPKWGVSIQAMIFRARELELITQETYERHFRNISAHGWRRARSEPFDDTVPLVNRSLGKKSLELLSASKFKLWEIASELPLPDKVFQSVFDTDLRSAVPDELDNVVSIASFLKSAG